MALGMDKAGFTNFYKSTTRVGSVNDLNSFYMAWFKIHNWGFEFTAPWNAKDPAYRMPKVCTKVKTKMLSMGCDAKTATRVITAFKKWYSVTYPNG